MTDTPDERPRPTPRPAPHTRPGSPGRPSPRPRVAGSRRDREETDAAPAPRAHATPGPRPAARKAARTAGDEALRPTRGRTAASAAARTRRRAPALVLVLALVCVVAAAGAGVLLWQRLNPGYVDTSVLTATRSGVQALYAYDYNDSEGSVQRKLDVLTGDLREQYETDLSQGGIIETYEQVSATTSYEVVDVGLQQINEAQDTATLVVFGQYVVQSATTGQQPAPEGSECEVSPEGAQSCTQTVQVGVVRVDGDWKINELTLLTTS
jgi:co-chaperonin GroES (HSP10)